MPLDPHDELLPGNEQERAELGRVLESGIFRRSPKLSSLLTYLCEKHFRGEAGQINEYGIAMDVLGRDAASFNPQVDAVVRVDAYHLRKRLKQYYDTEGTGHQVRIAFPSGQYAPEFKLVAEPVSGPAAAVETAGEVGLPAEAQLAAVPAVETPKPAPVGRRWLIACLAPVMVAAAVYATTTLKHSSAQAKTIPHLAAGFVETERGIRILAGDRAGDYVDTAGRTWVADRFFKGGTSFHRGGRPISRTLDPEIFETGREGQFAYEIPLEPGIYELHLYFAETGVSSEGLRGVNVAINGIPHCTLDVASDANGVNAATVKIYKDISPAKDGLLHLTFQGSDPSFLNALEIVPGIPGKMRPLRFTAGDRVYRDHLGQVWLPEVGVSGGRRSARSARIAGTGDPELYVSQRFGHFNYSIPVAEGGSYTVTLHFAETWFGLPNSPGGVGKRIFDVYCNGATLLKNFDILQQTGGVADLGLVKTFHNVPASPQGKLEISFVPVANYALLAAIEVVEE